MFSPGREKGGFQLSCSWWGARGRPGERGGGGGREKEREREREGDKKWECVCV